MQLIGLMLARSEDWIIGLSSRAALEWVDHLIVLDHCSVDLTREILETVSHASGRLTILDWKDAGKWDEMSARQATLNKARELGASHIAIIDADEILTANLIPKIRKTVEQLRPAQILNVAMIPVWNDPWHYRNDRSVWCRSWVSLAFADHSDLAWKPAEDGYHHHHRMPYGVSDIVHAGVHRGEGVMHLQFCNKRRLLAKHILYRMTDHLRWPGREPVAQLNSKYDEALDERGINLTPCSPAWWDGYDPSLIKLDGIPWQEAEVQRLISVHGRKKFQGLDLKGR